MLRRYNPFLPHARARREPCTHAGTHAHRQQHGRIYTREKVKRTAAAVASRPRHCRLHHFGGIAHASRFLNKVMRTQSAAWRVLQRKMFRRNAPAPQRGKGERGNPCLERQRVNLQPSKTFPTPAKKKKTRKVTQQRKRHSKKREETRGGRTTVVPPVYLFFTTELHRAFRRNLLLRRTSQLTFRAAKDCRCGSPRFILAHAYSLPVWTDAVHCVFPSGRSQNLYSSSIGEACH